MTDLLKSSLVILLITIATSNAYSQPSAGSYHYLDNTVYFDYPSVEDLSFIKENNESISVLFSSPHTSREIQSFINDLESKFKNRLLENGFTLKGISLTGGGRNEIQVLIDVLNHNNYDSYLVRVLVSKSLKFDERDDFAYRTLPIWKRMYLGYGNKADLKAKIRNNVRDGLDQLIKALNRE